MPRKMMTPHPSITGMAAGFTILDDLNKGVNKATTDVITLALTGKASAAINLLSKNAQDMVKTPAGRTSMVQAIAIAAAGAWARKALPGVKLGSTKIYARI